jgi:hypothetical protein
LAPPNPNELTAASAVPSFCGQSVNVVAMRSFRASASMFGFHVLKCRTAGILRRCTDSAALIRPAMPEAASR